MPAEVSAEKNKIQLLYNYYYFVILLCNVGVKYGNKLRGRPFNMPTTVVCPLDQAQALIQAPVSGDKRLEGLNWTYQCRLTLSCCELRRFHASEVVH
jgi:hypothetical protein